MAAEGYLLGAQNINSEKASLMQKRQQSVFF